MSIEEVIAGRDITELMHFTTNRGLVGILASDYLKSRKLVSDESYLKNILHPNAVVRPEAAPYFDRSEDWLDYVNLSISAINTSFMRFSKGWPHNQDIWWSILSFDPIIMTHPGVYFATTNNGYPHCVRQAGVEGLNRLFSSSAIRRKGNWYGHRGGRAAKLTTCEQAEVLYPSQVSLSFLRKIYVREDTDLDRARGWLRDFRRDGVEVVKDAAAFAGFPN